MKAKLIRSVFCLYIVAFSCMAGAAVVFDDGFQDASLNGWLISYDNTDSDNCSYQVSQSVLTLTGINPATDNLWTSFGIRRAVPDVADFHFKVDAIWEQPEISSAPFIKVLLYSGSDLVLSLNYEDRSKAGFGVSRCYASQGGWNSINSAPSANGSAGWEVDRIAGDVAVRLDGEIFLTFHDDSPITLVRVYLQGYAMTASSMPWQWQEPLAIGLDRIAMFTEAQNAIPAVSSLWLPSIFSDNMMLQQGKPNAVWGKAAANKQVTVAFDDQQRQIISDQDGRWSLELPAQTGGFQEHTLSVSCDGETVTFNHVLVGEVWLCSGQSNMEWWVGYTKEAQEALASDPDDNLRIFTVYKEVSDSPVEDPRGRWLAAKRDTVGDFSAIAYQFGLYLREQLNVPVGMVVAAWGGTRAECWVSREMLDEQFPSLIEWWLGLVADYDPQTMPYDADPMLAYYRPGGLYNGMICPVKPYSVRGFVWYQGESNVSRAEQYRTLFPALINLWRQDWNADLPFIFVQLPNYGTTSDVPRDSEWAQLRDAQNQALELPNVGIAVTIDIGDAVLLHPDNKKEVGRRLGLEARRIAYGDDTVPQSPRVEDQAGAKCDNNARLVFSYASKGGLAVRDGGSQVTGFTIAGGDNVFYTADAQITENNVVLVHSPSVNDPMEVRYAWDYNPLADLVDKDSGLPVGTFRACISGMDKELTSDISGDCYIDMMDLSVVCRQWLTNNDPENSLNAADASALESEVLLYDEFSDGERMTQQLPDSARWFKRLSADVEVNTSLADYRLEMIQTTIQQEWAHFTETDSPIVLGVGQSLAVSMRVSLPKAADTSWNRALMFGLFNSKGTRDQIDNSGTGAQRSDDSGYYVETNPGRTTAGYAKIQKMVYSSTAIFNDHFINYATLGTFSSFAMVQDVSYDVTFSVERVSETSINIAAKIGPGYEVSGVADVPADPDYFSFDTVSVLIDGRALPGDTGSVTIDKVKVTYSYPGVSITCDDIISTGQRLAADLNGDCYVEMQDVILLADQWIDCNDPSNVICL